MSRWLIALLALLLLAACSEPEPPEPPAPETERVAAETLEQAAERRADEACKDALRARWLALEHARGEVHEQPEQPEQPVEEPEIAPQPLPTPVAPPFRSAGDPVIAIVIDDIGHNLHQGRRLLALPVPVTLAILPHTHAARQLADEAAALGRPVMLHQPMENGAGLAIGPGGLYSDMPTVELQQTLAANLDSFEHIRGINNHMGSQLTADRQAMDQVMQVLRERGLYFIDSRTTHHTQAAFAAEAAGVAHLSRDVFLDNERSAEAIGRAFDQGLAVAREQGSALVIGHPYPQTIAFLEQRLAGDLLQEEGVEVISVEALLERKYGRR